MDGFLVLNKIGEGSFSTVLKVRRKEDCNIYALKRVKFFKLKEKEKLNALNEIRILASINNKNVISYKEAFFDENDSSLDIIMEYADKGDLFKLISDRKKEKQYFEEDEIWNVLIQLLKGLKALHELNILHRDLKSANVFLFSDGSVKLGDLNVSKVTRKGLGYTQTGTPYYASPEVWKDKPYDCKSDIWSLGCVIYEMATFNPPFKAKNMDELYKKVIRGFYPDISSRYSNDLKEILKIMIQTEVGARPNCDELLKMPVILQRIEKFNKKKKLNQDDIGQEENQILLRTIRIPNDISNFARNLPKPNYISNSFDTIENKEINKNIHHLKINSSSQKKDLNRKNNKQTEEENSIIKNDKDVRSSNIILTPIKVKNNSINIENRQRVNKQRLILSPSAKKGLNIKNGIILPEISKRYNYNNVLGHIDNNNQRNKVRVINIKPNISEKIHGSSKILQSENNIKSINYNVNNYRNFINLRLNKQSNINNKKNLLINESSEKQNKEYDIFKEKKIGIFDIYKNINNILNSKSLKNQKNLMRQYLYGSGDH